MPKYNVVYYLKKNHSPLITNRKPGSRVMIKLIIGSAIIANYIDEDPFGEIMCLPSEFHKIFCRNQSLVFK